MGGFVVLRRPRYTQVGSCVAIATLATAVFCTCYVRPAQRRLAGQSAQLAKIRSEIHRARTTAGELPAFRAEVAELERKLEGLRPVLPEEEDVADLLRRIQGMATESRLTIRAFQPRPVTRHSLYVEWPVRLEMEGTYHDVGHFLARVGSFPRIINVRDLEIRGKEKAGPGGPTVTVVCTATTFILTAQDATLAQPAGQSVDGGGKAS